MGDLQQIVLALQNVFTLGNLAIIFGGLMGMIVDASPAFPSPGSSCFCR
ncbi:MAG: hypothetical protein ACLUOI_34160 [Eisenbergiella sp.]